MDKQVAISGTIAALGNNIPLECLNETLKEIDKMVKGHEDILESTQHMFRMYVNAGKTETESLNIIRDINKKCADKARANKGDTSDGI